MTSVLYRALMIAIAVLSCCPSASAQVNYTANEVNPPYSGRFRPGVNLGYLPPWNNMQLGDLAAGNPALGIKGIGAKSTRPGLFDVVLDRYGYNLDVNNYDYYRDLGMEELTAIVGFPSDRHRDWANRYCDTPEKWNAMFKGLYLPIWDGGANGTPYNDDNEYAAYLYKVVSAYTDYVRFWEIWNEPGLYKGDPATSAVFWGGPEVPGSWWTNDPDPCDYYLHAPIEHYVRTLRISYEIIKTISPDDYVTISGLGSASFLDAIMRNSDNPIDGSITPAYPKLGGAYFDVLGFHTYPHFDGSTWFGNQHRARHSDGAADGIINRALASYQNVLYAYGYDDVTYPRKSHIATEVNVPRRAFTNAFFAGNDEQINFIQKCLISFKIHDVFQMHVYSIGDKVDSTAASFEFDLMGLYKRLEGVGPYNQQVNDEGIAYKTASDLIYPTTFDAAETQRLQAPDGVRAYAFAKTGGGYVYALWAETRIDLSEQASATYSFPAELNVGSLVRHEWNFSETGSVVPSSSTGITLTARPIYLVSNSGNGPSTNTAPRPQLSTASTTVSGPFDVTVTWNEPITGLSAADFRVTNGSVVTLSGTGLSYTVNIAPSAVGAVTIQLPAGAATDAEGLASIASNVLTVNSTNGGNPGGSGDNADVELAMTVDQTIVPIFNSVTFTLTARNTGSLLAEDIIVEFPMPQGLSYVSSTFSQGDYQAWSANWQVGSIPAGGAATLQLTLYTLTAETRTAYAQVINMRQFDPDSTPGNGACCTPTEDDEAAVTINGQPGAALPADLSLTLTSPQSVLPSDGNFIARVTVLNDGPNAANGILANVVVPPGIALVSSAIPTGSQLNGTNWTVGRLNVGESKTLEIAYRAANPAATAVVTAEIQTSSQPDPDSTPGNGAVGEDDRAVLRLSPASSEAMADLRLKLWSSVRRFRLHRNVTLTLEVENQGVATSVDNVVSFPVPMGTVFSTYSARQSSYDPDLGTWTIPQLAPGERTTLKLTIYTMRAAPSIICFAQVKASATRDSDSEPNNRQCCTAVEDDEVALAIQPWVVVLPPNDNGAVLEGLADQDDSPVHGHVKFHPGTGASGSNMPTVNFTTERSETEALLVDALGRVIRSVSLADAPGTYRVPVDLSDLPSGIYHLAIETEDGTETLRLVNTQ